MNDTIQNIKNASHKKSEFKWSKYRGGKSRSAYEALVDLFYLLINEKQAHFHCIVCHFKEFQHKWGGPGTPEKSVNRMYFQLGLHRLGRIYGAKARIRIFPDHGNDSSEIVQYRNAICARAYQRYGAKPNCIRSIEPTPSRRENILQMTDVIVGAIAAKREARILTEPKALLAEQVLSQSPVLDWSLDTPNQARRFTVWNFRHQR